MVHTSLVQVRKGDKKTTKARATRLNLHILVGSTHGKMVLLLLSVFHLDLERSGSLNIFMIFSVSSCNCRWGAIKSNASGLLNNGGVQIRLIISSLRCIYLIIRLCEQLADERV